MKSKLKDEDYLDVYGDESIGKDIVIYAVVAIRSSDNKYLEDALNSLKVKFEANITLRLHCREIFYEDKRRKTPWAHLDRNQVYNMYFELIDIISRVPTKRVITFARKSKFPKSTRGLEGMSPLVWEAKQLASLCATGALIPFAHIAESNRLRFWADKEETKIPWLGKNRQAMHTFPGFIDIGPGKEPIKILHSKSEKPSQILEIADFLAYASVKALSRHNRYQQSSEWKTFYSALRPEVIELKIKPTGEFGFDVSKLK